MLSVMKRKHYYESVKIYVESLGYTLLDKIYLGLHQKITLIDAEGYYLSITYNNLLSGKTPMRFIKYNPYTIQNIKLWCKFNNKTFEIIGDVYENAIKNIQWKCLVEGCGEIFSINWNNIVSKGQNCPYCSNQRVGLSNCLATKNPVLASEWHPTKNGDLTPYDVTEGSGKEAWWLCNKNKKHEWHTLIKDRRGCPYCSHRHLPSEDYNLLFDNPKLCEEWNYEKNTKLPEEYTPHSGQFALWKCKECGHEWEAVIASRNNGVNCPECAESKGEITIRNWLRLYNIYYTPQKIFNGLTGLGNGNLSYDFYLPSYNTLIEFQGEQHERFVKGMHKSEEDFIKQLEHDKRKKEYALNNGYMFLEIWYCDFDNIEEILVKELNKYKINSRGMVYIAH